MPHAPFRSAVLRHRLARGTLALAAALAAALMVPDRFTVTGAQAAPAAPALERVIVLVRAGSPAADPLQAQVAMEPLAADADGETRNAWRGRRDRLLSQAAERAHAPVRDRVAAFIEAEGGRVTHRFRLMPGLSAILPAELVERLRRHPEVVAVHEDRQGWASLITLPATLGLSAFTNAGVTGGSVDVAVVDSGIFLGHDAFRATFQPPSSRYVGVRRLTQAASSCPGEFCGVSPLEDVTSGDDFQGHGTEVAGVLASQGFGSYPNHLGVVHGLRKLVNVKVAFRTGQFDKKLGEQVDLAGLSAFSSDIIAGIEDALELGSDGPEVISLSVGLAPTFISPDDPVEPYDSGIETVARFLDAVVSTHGKLVAVAAGNGGPDEKTVESPAIAYNVLAVGATSRPGLQSSRADDVVWEGSSRGPTNSLSGLARKKPDLVAPGGGLSTTTADGGLSDAGGREAIGTSLAAPVVAGLATLLWDTPDLGALPIDDQHKPLAIKALLINSAEDRGAPGWDPDWGWGYVDGAAAYAQRGGVSTGDVGSTAPRQYFLRAAPAAATKATLVWNRPVTYSASTPTASPLKNLDFRLYALASGQVRASSTSSVDNVEQVTSTTAEAAVLVVEGNDTFSAGETTGFALAHGGGFVPAAIPQLTATLVVPAQVGTGSSFLVTATFANPAPAPALPVVSGTATLTLPPGYTADASTPATRSLPTVAAGGAVQVQWVVRAPAQADPASVPLSAQASTGAFATPLAASAGAQVQATAACTFALAPASIDAPAGGGSTSVTVTTAPACGWLASSSVPWVLVAAPAAGTGPATVGLVVAANGTGATRQGTVTVGSATVAITQVPAERVYYLAEGATGPLFDLDIAIANPNETPVNAEVTFLKPGGTTQEIPVPLAPMEQRVIRVDEIPGLEDTAVSTVVKSPGGAPLVVERTMIWGTGNYGGHGGSAVDGPRTTWYFAEGSQGFFDTFVLLANATGQDATVTLTFLRERTESPVVREVEVAANARVTFWTLDVPELTNRSFSIVVTSDVPIIVERAMYFPGATSGVAGKRFWEGGHESAGVAEPSATWFHAEGATGSFFDEYILVGNPGASKATVTFRFLLLRGQTVEVRGDLAAQGRMTVNVETVADEVALGNLTLLSGDPSLLRDAQLSTTVSADVPVISERAMYWSGGFTTWYEAHNSFGVTQTAARWGLAEGRTGGPLGFDTYILLSNPNAADVEVEVTLLRQGGRPDISRTFTVPRTSRFNVYVTPSAVGTDPGWGPLGLQAGEAFGAIVRSLDPSKPIAVERAMYWFGSDGLFWTGGTNATAVPLP